MSVIWALMTMQWQKQVARDYQMSLFSRKKHLSHLLCVEPYEALYANALTGMKPKWLLRQLFIQKIFLDLNLDSYPTSIIKQTLYINKSKKLNNNKINNETIKETILNQVNLTIWGMVN